VSHQDAPSTDDTVVVKYTVSSAKSWYEPSWREHSDNTQSGEGMPRDAS